jgi:putative SOS response-associated peptidase YedK
MMMMAGLGTSGPGTGRPDQKLHDHHVSAERRYRALYDQLPVIMAGKGWAKWLGEEVATPEELKALLMPFPTRP